MTTGFEDPSAYSASTEDVEGFIAESQAAAALEPVVVSGYDGPGDGRLHKLLDEIGVLHDMKQEDYGTEGDPFANVRASEQWGIPAWVGAMIRLNDKIKRLQALARRGYVANEDPEDSFKDIAVYALIALILYREWEDLQRKSQDVLPDSASEAQAAFKEWWAGQ